MVALPYGRAVGMMTSGVWPCYTSAPRRRFPSSSARPAQVECSSKSTPTIQPHSGFHQRVVQGVADAADRPEDPASRSASVNAIDDY